MSRDTSLGDARAHEYDSLVAALETAIDLLDALAIDAPGPALTGTQCYETACALRLVKERLQP